MDQTKKSIFIARSFVIAAFIVTSWALLYKVGVSTTDEAGIVMKLPEQVGAWHGVSLLFCPDRTCGGSYLQSQLDGATTCPECGKPLGQMNWAERSALPADTGLVRSYYVQPNGRFPIHTTIVLSGDDRSSIHRPEVCMTAAGYEEIDSHTIAVPIEGRSENLQIQVLDMARSFETENGEQRTQNIFYAYWFVGKGRETASHVQRMIWMASDRILHGISHRWAYIAISGDRTPASTDHLQTIANFASQLHPALLMPEDDNPAEELQTP